MTGRRRWAAQRWAACGLGGPSGGVAAPDVAAEVGRLGAVQAQDLDMTIWSLGQRTGQARASIAEAVCGPDVVRTHTLRPTWHLVRAEDLPKAQAATAERVRRQMATYTRQLGLDSPMLSRFTRIVRTALADATLTRAELRDCAAAVGLRLDSPAMGMAMMHLELDLVVGSGPPRGSVPTYRILEATAHPDREEAVRWLVGVFLGGHGPSSIRDVCAWSSLTVVEVRAAIDALGASVQQESILDEARYWMGDLPDAGSPSVPTVELLNGYDEYISGLSPQSKAHLDPDRLHAGRLRTPIATVMVDGMLAGNWRRTLGTCAVVEVELLRTLDASEDTALLGSAQRYAGFVGLPLDLTVRQRPRP